MKRLILAAMAMVAMVGCIEPKPMVLPFRSDDFQKYMGDGSGTVSGQAFLKTRGGDVKFGAGCEVELCPVTPYIKERLDRQTFGHELLEERDVRVRNFSRKTIADGNGNFEFKRVPSGRWVAYCVITWMVPGPYGGSTTGATAVALLDVKDNETTKAIVTR